MCTKQETAEVLHQEFSKDGGIKDELVNEVIATIKAMIFNYFVTGGAMLLFAIVTAWFSLYYQVQHQNDKINQNSELIANNLSKDQAALIIQRLDQLEEVVRERNNNIKALDDRLRSKGI